MILALTSVLKEPVEPILVESQEYILADLDRGNPSTIANKPLRKILVSLRKTYTDICRNWNDGGVVAKPGIATGSRS
jgi:hypothetical protein